MKKILLATSALIMTAGYAAAEVAVSGDARMGFVYDGAKDDGEKVEFKSRVRVKFKLTGETDTGLSFGASVRADNSVDGKKGTAGSVYVSGEYGTLSMGDVDGAAAASFGGLSGVGYSGISDEGIFYLSGGIDDDALGTKRYKGIFSAPAALYEYSMGNVTVYASMGNPTGSTNTYELKEFDFGNGPVDAESTVEARNQYAVAMKYDMGDYSVSLGYETVKVNEMVKPTDEDDKSIYSFEGTINQVLLGGSAAVGEHTINAVYAKTSDLDEGKSLTQYGLSGDFVFGATTASAYVRKSEIGDSSTTFYGVGAQYDLGGGATFAAGMVDNDRDGSKPKFDAGMNFKF